MMRDRAFRFPFFAGPIRRDAALAAFGVAALIAGSARADAPQVYAIRGARLVTAAGAPIASGTIVFRDGVIEAVGERVDVPAEARVIDGTGLTVYPGLFDLGNTAVVELAQPEPPRNARTTEEIERWKRSVILRPQLEAAEHVKADSPDLRRLAAAGITAVLAVPPGQVFKGRSALAVTAAPEDEPQIGAPADPRRGRYVLRAPVALHVEFSERPRGQAYPVSLMGVIAFVRQTFLDARHYEQAIERYRRAPGSVERPAHDPALEALGPALAGRLPVVFDAQRVREILRALRMAAEFNLDPIIAGGLEADQVAADLKARKARVIYSLNYPTRPRSLAPDADEPLRTLRERAAAPRTPAALARAGIPFAFASAGLREPRDFVRHAARAVAEGLPAEAAIRALTIDAARLAGVADRLGSLEKGKTATLIVTDGDLFEEKSAIRHVFVEGHPVDLTGLERPRERRGT